MLGDGVDECYFIILSSNLQDIVKKNSLIWARKIYLIPVCQVDQGKWCSGSKMNERREEKSRKRAQKERREGKERKEVGGKRMEKGEGEKEQHK